MQFNFQIVVIIIAVFISILSFPGIVSRRYPTKLCPLIDFHFLTLGSIFLFQS